MRLFPTSLQSAVRPRLACEIASDGILAGSCAGGGGLVQATAFVPLEDDAVAEELTPPAFPNRETVLTALRRALDAVNHRGRELTLILPDACSRVLLLDFDALPARHHEVLPLIRFRLRRLVPFDVDAAAVSYQVVQPSAAPAKNAPIQVLAAAMPAELRAEFESVARSAEREPGVLLPATLAAMAELPDTGSHLLVHTGSESITTAIAQEGELLLYRRTEHVLREPGEAAKAILIAAAYFEDRLQKPVEEIWVAGVATPEILRRHLEVDGPWQIPLRSLANASAFAANAVPANATVSRFASVLGALRG